MDYETYMMQALAQASKAFENGEFPVGCVIVQEGRVIATGARLGTSRGRTVFNEIDHAEIRALKALEEQQIALNPENAVIFSTMEPCLMCFGAIILSGIRKVVYSFEDPMGGGTSCDLEKLPPLYKNANIEIVSGVLREKSLDLFYDFFNKETNQYWKDSYLEAYTLDQKRDKQDK